MGTPRPFRVPYGLAPDGVLVEPKDASKDKETIRYSCPGCGDRLIVKEGTRKKHFSHGASSTCSLETALHRAAKYAIVHAIRMWKRGEAPAPIVERSCRECRQLHPQPLPAAAVDDAMAERRTDTGHVVDVGLIHGDALRSAVEIRVRHAVDDRKAAELPVPWIELDAEDVLKRPERWSPIRDAFKPVTCDYCRRKKAYREAEIRRVETALAEVEFDYEEYPSFAPVTTRACGDCGTQVPLYRYTGTTYDGTVPCPRFTEVVRARALYSFETALGLLDSPFIRLVVRSKCQRCGKPVQR